MRRKESWIARWMPFGRNMAWIPLRAEQFWVTSILLAKSIAHKWKISGKDRQNPWVKQSLTGFAVKMKHGAPIAAYAAFPVES